MKGCRLWIQLKQSATFYKIRNLFIGKTETLSMEDENVGSKYLLFEIL